MSAENYKLQLMFAQNLRNTILNTKINRKENGNLPLMPCSQDLTHILKGAMIFFT